MWINVNCIERAIQEIKRSCEVLNNKRICRKGEYEARRDGEGKKKTEIKD